MDRKTLVAAVGAVALTLAAASSAVAVNMGLLDASGDDGTRTELVTNGVAPSGASGEAPEVVHLTVRDLPPTGTGATGAARSTTSTPPAAAAPVPTAGTATERHGEHEDEHADDDEHEDHEDHDAERTGPAPERPRSRRGVDDDD